MILNIYVLSAAVMLRIFYQIQASLIVSEQFDRQVADAAESQFIDPACGPHDVFARLAHGDILGFSGGGRYCPLFFARPRNRCIAD